MTDRLCEYVVWEDAGLSYRHDGVYLTDFGWEWKVCDYEETWWDARPKRHRPWNEDEMPFETYPL